MNSSDEQKRGSVENIGDHRAYVCQCGSVHFNLLMSGNVECSGCGERGVFVYDFRALNAQCDKLMRHNNIVSAITEGK